MGLSDLSGADAAKYRDDRLSKVKPATIRRELVVLRHIFEVARSEWNIPLHSNPVHALKLPKDSRPRDRRLEADEAGKLLDALGKRMVSPSSPASGYRDRDASWRAFVRQVA